MAVILLKNVRLAFPHLFTPTSRSEDKPNEKVFNGTFIFEDPNPTVTVINSDKSRRSAKLQDVIREVATERWKDKAPSMLKTIKLKNKLCLRNGDMKEQYEGFAGNYFIGATSKNRPTLRKLQDGQPVPVTEEDGVIYAGCYGDVSLDIWAQDNKHGQGINAGLRGFLFTRDGDAFAGGGAADDDEFDLSDTGGAGDGEAESLI